VTAINLGRGSPHRLGAAYPRTPRNQVVVRLLGIAARRDCPFHPAGLGEPRSADSSLLL